MTSSSEVPPTGPTPSATRREWLGLAVLVLPILLISVDFSVLNLALPQLTRDLSASSVQQLWILDIYGFMMAGFLITMGVAAATLAPSGLALINHMFQDPKQRAAAVAVFTGGFMGGAVAGPVVGGVMLANFWWGSVFLLAVPVVLLLLATGPILLPEYRSPEAGRPDLVSVLLSLAAILPTVYGITELARDSRQYMAWGAIVIGVVAGALFVARQLRLPVPLLDLGLFADRTFRGGASLSLVGGAVQGGSLLMINLYLQMVKGYSPLRAGLWMVPPALAMFVTIGLGPALARSVRPAYIIAAGMVASSVGYLVITQVSAGGLMLLIVGFAIAMAGIGPGLSLGYGIVLDAAPRAKAGAASATVETGGQLGVAAGIAILGSLGNAVYRSHVVVPPGLPPRLASAAHDTIAEAVAVAGSTHRNGAVAGLLETARGAFTSGLHSVALIGAALFIGLAILALATLRQVPPIGQQAGQEASTAEPETTTASAG